MWVAFSKLNLSGITRALKKQAKDQWFHEILIRPKSENPVGILWTWIFLILSLICWYCRKQSSPHIGKTAKSSLTPAEGEVNEVADLTSCLRSEVGAVREGFYSLYLTFYLICMLMCYIYCPSVVIIYRMSALCH